METGTCGERLRTAKIHDLTFDTVFALTGASRKLRETRIDSSGEHDVEWSELANWKRKDLTHVRPVVRKVVDVLVETPATTAHLINNAFVINY